MTPRNRTLLAPTTLAGLFSPPISAGAVNRLLEARGLQIRDGLNWRPTAEGEKFAEAIVTGYRNRDGSYKVAIRWDPAVVKLLNGDR